MTRPKDIGTATESAVVKHLRASGFPHAERRALRGELDAGDITGTPGIAWEVKGGKAAEDCQPKDLDRWLRQASQERDNAGAAIGVLVTKARGVGPARAGDWWAWVRVEDLVALATPGTRVDCLLPVRLKLSDLVEILRRAGYGDPL